MPHIPSIPTFAVVGQTNQGKSSLLSTLTENDKIEVTPIPGTTRLAREYSVKVDRKKVLSFWDTPGFEQPAETLRWFEELDDEADNPAADFIAAFGDNPEFEAECEIFKPLSKGAAVILIVDSSRKVKTPDKQLIEILRRCGNPRIAVIYSKNGTFLHREDWRKILTRDFTLRHDFNSHEATYRDRLELLEAVRTIIPEWREPMDATIDALASDRRGREMACAAMICDLFKSVLETRITKPLQPGDDREEVGKRAQEKLKAKLRKVEASYRKQILKLFRHSEEHWEMDSLLNMDLFSEEVWEVFGMTKKQFVAASAITGAIIGAGVDTAFGWVTLGAFTALGGAGGALGGHFGAERIADLKYPEVKLMRFSLGGGKVGGGQIEAKTSPKSNLISILLDRALLYAEQAGRWAHGKREETLKTVIEESDKEQLVSQWSSDERKELATFVGHLASEKSKRADLRGSRAVLEETLYEKLHNLLN